MKKQMKEDLKNLFRDKKKKTLITVVGSLIILSIAGTVIAINANSKALVKESVEESVEKEVEESSKEIVDNKVETIKIEENKSEEEQSEEDKDESKEADSTERNQEIEIAVNSSESSVSTISESTENIVTSSEETTILEPSTSESNSEEIDPLSAEAIAKAYPKIIGPDAPKIREERVPLTPVHQHSWTDWIENVTIPEEGHFEEVMVTPEKAIEAPIYEKRAVEICSGCGADITGNPLSHIEAETLKGNKSCSGFTTSYKEVQIGTKQEVIPAVYEKKWVVDKAASTEKVVVGKACRTCSERIYE